MRHNTPLTYKHHLKAWVRECWVLASDYRLSAIRPGWTTEPTLHTAVIESINVDEQHRRKGLCRDFLKSALKDTRFDLVIVEGVQNPHLATALWRWGWKCNEDVMDFWKIPSGGSK